MLINILSAETYLCYSCSTKSNNTVSYHITQVHIHNDSGKLVVAVNTGVVSLDITVEDKHTVQNECFCRSQRVSVQSYASHSLCLHHERRSFQNFVTIFCNACSYMRRTQKDKTAIVCPVLRMGILLTSNPKILNIMSRLILVMQVIIASTS